MQKYRSNLLTSQQRLERPAKWVQHLLQVDLGITSELKKICGKIQNSKI